jgi:hypothetical protein
MTPITLEAQSCHSGFYDENDGSKPERAARIQDDSSDSINDATNEDRQQGKSKLPFEERLALDAIFD